jgi:hypothetical protein
LVASAQLVQVQSLVLGLPIGTDGQRVAQNQLVVSIDGRSRPAAHGWR